MLQNAQITVFSPCKVLKRANTAKMNYPPPKSKKLQNNILNSVFYCNLKRNIKKSTETLNYRN